MELKQIKELMSAMGRSGIKKVMLKEGEFELVLEREDYPGQISPESLQSVYKEDMRTYVAPLPRVEMPIHHLPGTATPEEPKEEGQMITSPMVGTFYESPSPEAPAYLKVGDVVSEKTVVCIIEAMKVMNEVKAGISGTVAEILVQNGHPVEFGTKLFRIV